MILESLFRYLPKEGRSVPYGPDETAKTDENRYKTDAS